MATNDPVLYGRDIRCLDDADALFSDVTGLDVVIQDVYHRLTNDSVLGSTPDAPNVDADNWGFDVTKLAGMALADLATIPPLISAAVQKDPRIATCDVSVRRGPFKIAAQMWSAALIVTATTALGPFTLIVAIGDTTVQVFSGSAT